MTVAITIDRVEKVYGGRPTGVHALGPVDLAVEPATFVSLLGPSGCGKSTLLLMLAGLLPPSAGDVAIDGRPVRGPYTDLGIVFQSHALVDWRTVLGNVLLQVELRGLDRKRYRERALDLLASVGLAAFAERRLLPRAGPRPAARADGRAARGAGRHDTRAAPRRPRGLVDADPQDGGASHPQHRGGGPALRPGSGGLAAARPDRARYRGRP